MANIAKVIVEIALDREFDYEIPAAIEEKVELGSVVEVPFGKRFTRGYVIGLADGSDCKKLKRIQHVVGDKPLITPNILGLA